MLSKLNDQELIKTYNLAIHLNLEKEFIDLLRMELKRRKLDKVVNQKQG